MIEEFVLSLIFVCLQRGIKNRLEVGRGAGRRWGDILGHDGL